MSDIGDALTAAGMAEGEVDAKRRLAERCTTALHQAHASTERSWFFVPGRIEILGKHTDYAGGRSLLCAVERGFVVLAGPRSDDRVRVVDAARGEVRELRVDPDIDVPRNDWASYVAATVRRLARNFPHSRRGADIAFASDLPAASGMSSSSALSTGMFLALDSVNGYTSDPTFQAVIRSREDLAGYLGTIENGQSFGPFAGDAGVGTFGGSEDHTAILCCRAGYISQYSFDPVRFEREIVFPETLTFVVAFSGVAAEKGAGAQERYNELSLAVQRLLSIWNQATGRTDAALAAAVESSPDASRRVRELVIDSRPPDFTKDRLLERLEQFVAESTVIIPSAGDAFARGDLSTFGALVDRSQRGAELLLKNQIPETISLVRTACELGAHAASAFGGGFGGSVWALVSSSTAAEFAALWREGYAKNHAVSGPEFIVTRPGPPVPRATR